MRLYYTPNSPYARIARVALRESGLAGRCEEIVAATRARDTPYFSVTPLARVPYLVDGTVRVGDTRDICRYFDGLEGKARWCGEEDHARRFLRHVVSGFLDGVAVWLRENARPAGQRSDPVMAYETHRAEHVLEWLAPRWEVDVRPFDFTALSLAAALDIALDRGMGNGWGGNGWGAIAPDLLAWAARQADMRSMRETAPLPA